MANTCPVCGGKLGLLNREKSADGLICASCSNFFFSKLGIRAAKQSTAALADYWATLEQRRKVFKETDSIYDGDALFVSIDKTDRLFCIGHRSGDKGPRMIYSFDEVAGYESDAPDDLTVTETKGGIGRAVIGAAVAGPVGAIVGAATAKTETRKGRSKESVSIRFALPLGESSLPTMVYPGGMTAFLKGTAKLDNHKYKSLFHIKAKMIPYDEVEAYVGHAPGGVCPFGVNEGVAVYLDESLRKFDTVYPAAGNGHTAVKLTLQELEAAAGAEGWVDVCKEPEGE